LTLATEIYGDAVAQHLEPTEQSVLNAHQITYRSEAYD
jgi:hypothetical protein